MPELTTEKQVTTNYAQFTLLETNRERSRGHIEALKRAWVEGGNLTKVDPIKVNENLEVIDGQHRLTAAEELGEPVYFTVNPGLSIQDARQMNILHRTWYTDDYAGSYSRDGNQNYIKYLELKEMYGFSHSIMVLYINGLQTKGQHKDFREGTFVIDNEKQALKRLDELSAIVDVVGDIAKTRAFALAYLKVRAVDGFDFKQMIRKFEIFGGGIKSFNGLEDNQRQLEDIYNYKQTETNRLRLF